jgi:broad specificity phosphatase PhoE
MLGAADLPLSPTGRAYVTAEAERVFAGRIATVCHPDVEAAAESAAIFARTVRAKTKTVVELGDPNLGLFEGLTSQDIADRYPKRFRSWDDDPLSLVPPEGEPMSEARARIFAAVARLLKRTRSDEVAIVLGTLGLGLLRCWLADLPESQMWRLLDDRPGIERYVLAPSQVEELADAARMMATRA